MKWALLAGAGLFIIAYSLSLPRAPAAYENPTSRVVGGRVWFSEGHYAALPMPEAQKRVVISLLHTPRPMRFGEFLWNDRNVPEGRIWLRVDLKTQMLSVFRGDHEIGTAVVLYGTDGKPTPAGLFPVLERQKEHRSSLYDAEMPYMLRLTNDGVAVHASDVQQGSATHGCIGVPLPFARLLYSQVKRGDVVAILGAVEPRA